MEGPTSWQDPLEVVLGLRIWLDWKKYHIAHYIRYHRKEVIYFFTQICPRIILRYHKNPIERQPGWGLFKWLVITFVHLGNY
jgi:hypothetical protein